jgi:hypothetical protein
VTKPDQYEDRRRLERRLHRTGAWVVGPVVAVGDVLWTHYSLDDGSIKTLDALWIGPAMAVVLGLAFAHVGAVVGMLLGPVVARAWGCDDFDFGSHASELLAVGGGVGGLLLPVVVLVW